MRPEARSAARTGHVVVQVLAIVAVGLLAGAADSWLRPVKLSASEPGQPGAGAPSPAPARPDPAPPVAPGPQQATSGTPTSVTPTPGEVAPAQAAPAADEPLQLRITLAQARKLFERGTPFLDARTDEEFRAGHIAGAFHLPSDAFDRPGGADDLKFLDQNAPVVIYCGGGDCHASEYVAIRLEQAGFKSYHIMIDGFPAWKAAGYDVAEGEK